MDINHTLNEVLVRLFRDINTLEERAIRTEEYKDVTANDMHVRGANGTPTIAVNSLVKKGYVDRTRSEEDRRVVLISLSGKGKKAYIHHRKFHEEMIDAILKGLSEEEQRALESALSKLTRFFRAAV